jgi:hypothetical protein
MALNHSSKIITDGLVFYYDANNRKSWNGGPLTNLYWNNGSPFAPWTVGGTNTDITGTYEDDGPIKGAKTYKFNKSGTSNQWNGWEGTYGNIWTGNAGDIWTTSYWYKTAAPAGLTSFGVGSFYLSDWSRAYSSTILSNVNSIIPDGKWHYNYTVTQINEAYTNAITVDGPSWGYSTSSGVLYLNGLQWNKNSYASSPYGYAFGARSNTDSIKDLVGGNTITANSLTYNYDGTGWSFNGTSNYITIPQPSIQVSPNRWTISGWIKPNANQDTFFLTPQSAGVDHFLALTSTGQFRFSITESADVNNRTYYSPAGTVPAGSWTHFSASIDNLTIKLFLNGVQHINQTETIPIANWSGNWIIGQRGNNTFWLNGNISGLSVYNKDLSDSEVKQNFNALRGRYGV